MRAVVDTSAWVAAVLIKACRDRKDDMIIETAIRGEVDLLVSADKDLTDDPNVTAVLAEAGVRVMAVAEFLKELEAAEE